MSRMDRNNRISCRPLVLLAALLNGAGCAAMTNPTAQGIPVRKLPTEMHTCSRTSTQTIPLTWLQQPPPAVYRLAPGDVLGVQIDGILGTKDQPVPVHVPTLAPNPGERQLVPSTGLPVTVQHDGTIALPFVPPIPIAGATLQDAAELIKQAYAKIDRFNDKLDRVLVSLTQQRTTEVLVFRQEGASFTIGQTGIETGSKRGTGHLLQLPGYENDLLHALARTGGLPGLDAYNQIVIFRGCFHDGAGAAALLHQMGDPNAPRPQFAARPVVRIPLRMQPGSPAPFLPQEVILSPGDVVFVEARDQEVFYTAGLLPPGVHVLPRDFDLDVLRAIAQVRGPLFNGAFGGSNLSGTMLADGIGNPSPSLLVVLRRTPSGGQVPIVIDLHEAVMDPRERLNVQPGDLLVLQERPADALARYVTTTFFNFNFLWQSVRGTGIAGLLDLSTFNRVQNARSNISFTPR